jgi:hypothetical protein
MDDAMRATDQELRDFEEKGFFCRPSVFSAAELAELREGAERVHQRVLEAAERDDAPPCDRVDNQRYQTLLGSTIKWEWDQALRSVRSMEPCHHLDPRLDALIDDARLWGPAASVIGREELSLFSDKLNMKPPGAAPFPWHQEGPYWVYGAEQLDKIVSVLTYLDDATQENGCLWVISGSHKHGTLKGLEDRGVLGALYTDVDWLREDPGRAAGRLGDLLPLRPGARLPGQPQRHQPARLRGGLPAGRPAPLAHRQDPADRGAAAGLLKRRARLTAEARRRRAASRPRRAAPTAAPARRRARRSRLRTTTRR